MPWALVYITIMKLSVNVSSEPEFSPALKGTGTRNIFTIPEGYFENLAAVIERRVEEEHLGFEFIQGKTATCEDGVSRTEEQVELFAGESGTEQSDVSYFENLAARILTRVSETENPATLKLADLSIPDPYTVPEGYFDRLPGIIAREVISVSEIKKKDRIRQLQKGAGTRRLTISKYAAAASIAALLVFTGIRFNISRERNKEYARSGTEERFNYRYDIDESLVEDELVSQDHDDSIRAMDRANDPSTGEKYLLEHGDVNTLIEEI